MLCQCTPQFNSGSCKTRSPSSVFQFCSSIPRYSSLALAQSPTPSTMNLQWNCSGRQMLWAPLSELCKNHLLTNIHPVDMQRGDAFWGVAVQDHRISMLHIQRLDFFFGELWYTCTKKQRNSSFIGTFWNFAFCFPLDRVLIKYLPLHHPLHSLPLIPILIYTEAQSNDEFYSE